MSNKNKPKRLQLTKEQLVLQAQQKKEELARKKFIDEKFFPCIESVVTTLEDATRMAETLKVAINQAFLNTSKEMTIADLGLIEMLNKKDDVLTKKYTKVLEMLSDETVDNSLRMCDGLFNEANRVLIDQMQKQKLSDFKPKDKKKKK